MTIRILSIIVLFDDSFYLVDLFYIGPFRMIAAERVLFSPGLKMASIDRKTQTGND